MVMPKITKEMKQIRDLEAAMAVYMGRRPFNTYKNKYMVSRTSFSVMQLSVVIILYPYLKSLRI